MKPGVWLALAAATAAWAQTEGAIERDGGRWVQKVSGTALASIKGHLRVETRGAVTIRGEERDDIAYVLKKRVRAGGEEDARRLLNEIRLRTTREGDLTILRLGMSRSGQDAELLLRVPRGLRETQVASLGGVIDAEGLEGDLRAVTQGGEVRADQIQGGLLVKTGGGRIRLGSIGGPVRCVSLGGPISADLLHGEAELETSGGNILVREAAGVLRANTAGGNIRIERAGSVHASTGSGLIEVLQAGGPVSAQTGSGAIRVSSANGADLSSAAGTIELRGISGGLRASTAAGDILAELPFTRRLADSALTTSQGDVLVYVPSNLAVTIQATNSGSGMSRIVTEFPEIQVRRLTGRAEAEGTINGGGPLLKISASGGTIFLRRQR